MGTVGFGRSPTKTDPQVPEEGAQMRRTTARSLPIVLTTAALAFGVVACGNDDSSSGSGSGGAAATATAAAKAKVGVILPDTASSARWEGADRPLLGDAFKAAGVDADIQNANGDKAKFATIADQMLNE